MSRLTIAITLVTLLVLFLPPLAAANGRSCWLCDAASPSDSIAYLLCEEGSLLATTNGGTTWTSLETGAAGRLRAMAFLDANRGFVVGDNGALLATSDGGKTWQTRETGVREQLMSIHFAGDSGWAAGYNGVVIHSADGGRTWKRQPTGVTQSIESIFFADAEHGWAAGWVGTILRTSDGGRTWETVKTPAAAWTLNSVYFRDAKNGWIAGFAGQILRTRDGGATWEAQASPVRDWLKSVTFDRAGRGWISSDNALLISEDGGESWKTAGTEDRLFLSKVVPVQNAVWAISPFGVLKRSGTSAAWQGIKELVPESSASSGTPRAGAERP